jgi:hypothetical protein
MKWPDLFKPTRYLNEAVAASKMKHVFGIKDVVRLSTDLGIATLGKSKA